MAFKTFAFSLVSAALIAAAPVSAVYGDSAVILTPSDLKWRDIGNGVQAAPVSGDMEKGPSRFFLKYPVGLVTPRHHHDADHYVTVISGIITLTVEGRDHRLGPGSYFALTSKDVHIAKVEGKDAAIFFIQAEGPWNVAMEK